MTLNHIIITLFTVLKYTKRTISEKTVLDRMHKLALKSAVYFPYLADMHIISNIFPINSNVYFHPYSVSSKQQWELVKMDCCEKPKLNRYHPKLGPIFGRATKTHISYHQDVSLVVNIDHLRFVSCHKKRLHWVYQLNELVSVFDVLT